MKKKNWIVIVIFAIVFGLGLSATFTKDEVSNAQTTDIESQKRIEERQKRIDRDESIPKEKIKKAYAEAKKINDDISKVIAEKKPDFNVDNRYSSHLISISEGQLGETLDDISWFNRKTKIGMQIRLGFNNEEALTNFRRSMNSISMGEFFAVPNVGDEAVLVKNVNFNTKTTNVGLHFVKGRAQVDIYVANYKRKTEKNEKELMEILRLVEPLIVARPNFDD